VQKVNRSSISSFFIHEPEHRLAIGEVADVLAPEIDEVIAQTVGDCRCVRRDDDVWQRPEWAIGWQGLLGEGVESGASEAALP
jgi:hypothetical protein